MKVIEEVKRIKKQRRRNNWNSLLFFTLLTISIVVIAAIWIFPNIITINGVIYLTIPVSISLAAIIGAAISFYQLLNNLRSSSNKSWRITSLLRDLEKFEMELDKRIMEFGDLDFIRFQTWVLSEILGITGGSENSELTEAYEELLRIYREMIQGSASEAGVEIISTLRTIENIWIVYKSEYQNHFDYYLHEIAISSDPDTSARNFVPTLRGIGKEYGWIKRHYDRLRAQDEGNKCPEWEDVEQLATPYYGI
ncbi:hypothetical protein ACFLZS_01665 [Patescibacteria group bacterium]